MKTLLVAFLSLAGLNARAEVDPVTPQLADGVYQIGTAAELLGFAALVNGDPSNRGASAVLTADIDMTDAVWTPICNVFSNYTSYYGDEEQIHYGNYSGTFDGQNHTISNLVYSTSDAAARAALFGNVSAGAVIKNITLDTSCSFTTTGTGVAKAGGFVGYIGYQGTDSSKNSVTLQNLVNKGTVTNEGETGCAGGIVGSSMTGNTGSSFGGATAKVQYVYMQNCSNEGTVSSSNSTDAGSERGAGGLIGYADTPNLILTDCENKGSVTGTLYVGGIASKMINTVTMTRVSNTGSVSSTGNYLGGIAGVIGNETGTGDATGTLVFTMNNVSNSGDVTSSASYVGGLIGQTSWRVKTVDITECLNSGKVKSTATATNTAVGGLVGAFYKKQNGALTLTSCVNSGDVEAPSVAAASNADVGGLVGWLRGESGNTLTATNCYNTGNISSTGAQVGGLIGVDGGSTTTNLTGCYNTGAISGVKLVGGLAGAVNIATIQNCWNTGSVSSTGIRAAGIVGQVSNSSAAVIKYCFNQGTILGGSESAAITGHTDNAGAVVSGCFNTGTVTGLDGKMTLYRPGTKGTYENNYDLSSSYGGEGEALNPAPEGYAAGWLTSGQFCYLLNGDQSLINWYQTIGTDAIPYPVSDGHLQVYASGAAYCDGTAKEGTVYNNVSASIVTDRHTNVNGFCTVCKTIQTDFLTPVDGYYELGNAVQLVWFSALVNTGLSSGVYTYTGVNAKLTADIDMSGYANFTPICDQYANNVPYAHYYGTFDGQGHTIDHLTISHASRAGLFGNVGKGAVIKDLTIGKNSTITGTGGVTGAFIAYCARYGNPDATTITLSGLTNKAAVSGVANSVGGIVGRNWSGNEAATGYSSVVHTLHISDCTNEGKVTSTASYVGGILGNPDVPCVATNLRNTGNISGVAKVGGIMGYKAQSTTMTNCVNTGTISGTSTDVAGLVGNSATGLTVTDCSNSGSVTSTFASGDASVDDTRVGGLVGWVQGTGNTFTNTYNDAAVDGLKFTGGLIGCVGGSAKVAITRCWNTASISGGTYVGGLVGSSNASSTLTLSNSYSTGNVTSTGTGTSTYTGGIIGSTYTNATSATLTNCFCTGTVTADASATDAGDVAGGTFATKGTMTNCYGGSGASGTTATGALCYALNKGAAAYVFHQTIGTDATPVLDPTHGYVNQITAAGYATMYVGDEGINVPAGVTAYSGKVEGTRLVLSEIGDKVPAATGFVLKGAEGYYSFMPTTGASAVSDNDLKGTATTLDLSGKTDKYYVLLKPSDAEIGFYKVTDVVAAGKAYLQLTGGAGVKGFTFADATGLTPAIFPEEGEGTDVYDLSGRRVVNPTKGLYIVNGKKILK